MGVRFRLNGSFLDSWPFDWVGNAYQNRFRMFPRGRAKQCPVWTSCRSGRAEQHSSGRIRAGACLSEASLHPTPPDASSARNPKGPDCGSPFFADFLWRSKESQCAAGRNTRPTVLKRAIQSESAPPLNRNGFPTAGTKSRQKRFLHSSLHSPPLVIDLLRSISWP
jgi:hypothetical protein